MRSAQCCLGGLLCATLLGGCEATPSAPSPVPNPILAASTPAEALQAAEQIWAARRVTRYDFSVAVGCFCRSIPFPLYFQVRDGVSVSPGLDDETRARVAPYESIEALFEVLRESLARNPETFEVEYHPWLGYPMSASIDLSERLRDDTLSVVVRTFSIVP